MVFSCDDQSIVAQCTPRGSGALAIVRLSGVDSFDIACNFVSLKSKKSLWEVCTHTINFGVIFESLSSNSNRLGDSGNSKALPVDQVMVVVMRGPRTFTGQDTVEIICHNNQLIVDKIISLAINFGARLAREGEFSQRSFLNNKIDLVQAEAIGDVINAQNSLALKKSMEQLDGSLSRKMSEIEGGLLHILSLCEASFEFVEEVSDFRLEISEKLEDLMREISLVKKNFSSNTRIRHGARVAIVGSVNVGKSSLLNILLDRKRSIVSSISGTTRDTIEAFVTRNGKNLTIIDTAGIGVASDLLENEGMERSLLEICRADVVLLVFDGSSDLSGKALSFYLSVLKDHGKKVILIQNKSDLSEFKLDFFQNIFSRKNILKVSCVSSDRDSRIKNYTESIFAAIDKKIEQLFSNLDAPFLLNERQYNLVLGLERLMKKSLDLSNGLQYELVSLHIKDALEQVGCIYGKTIEKKLLDKIFGSFCIGK